MSLGWLARYELIEVLTRDGFGPGSTMESASKLDIFMSVRAGYRRDDYGIVYRAYDPALGREVALKTVRLPSTTMRDTARLWSEARTAAEVGHPNIVTVYESGEIDGVPYMAMELITGSTLWDLLDYRGPLALGRVIGVMRGLCSALDCLHVAGMIHGDVSARNVMLDRDERAILIDFGLARRWYPSRGASPRHPRGYRHFRGTPAYMAPETCRGEESGPPADVYALGVLTYQLLAGRPPFTGSVWYVLRAHETLPPPDLGMLRPGLPEHVYRAVERALAKQPNLRPPSASAFLAELEDETIRWPVLRVALVVVAALAGVGCAAALVVKASAAGATPVTLLPSPLAVSRQIAPPPASLYQSSSLLIESRTGGTTRENTVAAMLDESPGGT